MQPHIKNYRQYYKIGEQDIVLCEVCGAVAGDIHHCIFRSQGGSDDVSNLCCLCRYHHEQAHKKILSAEYLLKLAKDKMQAYEAQSKNRIR